MSNIFKGLNRSDVYLTDYNSKRKWSVSGSSLAELGIKVMVALSGSSPYYNKEEDWGTFQPVSGSGSFTEGTYNKRLLYNSIYELYYKDSLKDGTFSGSKESYLQTTLTITGSRAVPTRNFRDDDDSDCLPSHQQDHNPTGFVVVSIPKEVFGTKISPESFKVKVDSDVWCYVEDGYMNDSTGQACDYGYPEQVWTRESDHWVDPYFEDLHIGENIYDFEGVLLGGGFLGNWHWPDEYRYPTPVHQTDTVVGDIIYTHGQIIFTNEFLRYVISNWNVDGYEWESNKPVFTEHFTCKVRDIDFNKTYNNTATEELQNTPGFTPYVSAVGLYNTEGVLLAVAKLSKPIKKALDTEMTFDIQIDLG